MRRSLDEMGGADLNKARHAERLSRVVGTIINAKRVALSCIKRFVVRR